VNYHLTLGRFLHQAIGRIEIQGRGEYTYRSEMIDIILSLPMVVGGYLVLEDFDLRVIKYVGRIRWDGKQERLEII
jgi:hypothetical protein